MDRIIFDGMYLLCLALGTALIEERKKNWLPASFDSTTQQQQIVIILK